MESVSAPRIRVPKPIYISHLTLTPAKVTATKLVVKAPALWGSLLSLRRTPARVIAETVGAARATTRTTGPRIINATNGTVKARVLHPSCSNTTSRNARQSACVIQQRASSSGTKQNVATACIVKVLVLRMLGSYPPGTCQKCIVNAETVSSSHRKNIPAKGRNKFRFRAIF